MVAPCYSKGKEKWAAFSARHSGFLDATFHPILWQQDKRLLSDRSYLEVCESCSLRRERWMTRKRCDASDEHDD